MGQQLTRFITMVLFLLALCFFTGNLGAFASDSNHLVGSLLLFVALLMMFPSPLALATLRLSRKQLFALVSTVSALAILVVAKEPVVWIAAACLFAFGLSTWVDGKTSAQWFILGLTAALCLMIFAFLSPLEPFWRLSLNGSVYLTRKLGALVDHTLIVASSASGWWIGVLFLCYFLARFIIENRWRTLMLGMLSVLAVFAAFNLINLHYPLLRYHTHTGLNFFNSQILCFALGAGVLYFFHRGMSIPEAVESQTRFWFILLAQVLIVLSVVGHYTVANGLGKSGGGGRVIIFGKEPSASYGTPSYDRLGVGASGMYGLLPKYLRAAGFEVTVVEETERLNEMLDQARIVGKFSVIPCCLLSFVNQGSKDLSNRRRNE